MIKIVGSALIKNKEGKYLAVKINKEHSKGVFVPPGGKLEVDETVRECVIREVKEELGVDIEIKGLEAITEEEYEDGHWVFILYGAKIINGTPKIMEPGKILEMKWVNISEFKKSESIRWVK